MRVQFESNAHGDEVTILVSADDLEEIASMIRDGSVFQTTARAVDIDENISITFSPDLYED